MNPGGGRCVEATVRMLATLCLLLVGCSVHNPARVATAGGGITVRFDVSDRAVQNGVARTCGVAVRRQVDAFNVEVVPNEQLQADATLRCLTQHSHVLRAKRLG